MTKWEPGETFSVSVDKTRTVRVKNLRMFEEIKLADLLRECIELEENGTPREQLQMFAKTRDALAICIVEPIDSLLATLTTQEAYLVAMKSLNRIALTDEEQKKYELLQCSAVANSAGNAEQQQNAELAESI